MNNWKAMKSGIKSRIKSLAGLPYRSTIRDSWQMSSDEFWRYQIEAFSHTYEFARTKIPFYQEQGVAYPPLNFGKDHLLQVLNQLPVLQKKTLKDHNTAFWPSTLPRLATFHTTSGTSGTPLRIAGTLGERGFSQAILEEWILRCCGTRYPRTLSLSGFMTPAEDKELYWEDPIFKNVFLSIYSLKASNRIDIVSLYHRFRPQLIYGYASAVHQLALLLGMEVQQLKDACIAIVTSEVLQPQWRTAIEASICRKVFNLYGSQEGQHSVMECASGQMHINPLVGIVEIVDADNQRVQAGEFGRVLVTGLTRRTMPLIRYELGDVVESTGYATDCTCGLKWPTIGQIEGRSEDLVRTRDGRYIGYLCFHATKNLRGIKEAQLIQVNYEKFIFNIVKSESESPDNKQLEYAITQQIMNRLRLPVEIDFRYISSIPRGSRGKFKAVSVDFEDKT